jgi:3-phenylpropionate/trans-cinnamate dioxygenase ferredoxin subunit
MAQKSQRKRKRFNIGPANLQPGEKRLVEVNGKRIGVFNVAETYYALHNHCPHMGGNLCEGPVTGTSITSEPGKFVYGMAGELVRCSWHGWEFEIKTGRCLADDRMRVRSYEIIVENEHLILHI